MCHKRETGFMGTTGRDVNCLILNMFVHAAGYWCVCADILLSLEPTHSHTLVHVVIGAYRALGDIINRQSSKSHW